MISPDSLHESVTNPFVRLASLLREVQAAPEYRTASTYASMIADLMTAHDLVKQFPRGTDENRKAYSVAKTIYDNARIYASKHGLQHPNEVLRAAGYTV